MEPTGRLPNPKVRHSRTVQLAVTLNLQAMDRMVVRATTIRPATVMASRSSAIQMATKTGTVNATSLISRASAMTKTSRVTTTRTR